MRVEPKKKDSKITYLINVQTIHGRNLTYKNVTSYEIIGDCSVKFVDQLTGKTKSYPLKNVEIDEVCSNE